MVGYSLATPFDKPSCKRFPTYYNPNEHSEEHTMQGRVPNGKIAKQKIYRSVASSTAIETGVAVHEIEKNLKQYQAQAKAIGLAR